MMIILYEYPISMAEHNGFRMYSKALQLLLNVVSQNTIRSDIMKIYKIEKTKTKKLIEHNHSRIVITTDM